ncbi:MAG: ABC transporter permease [Gemmatimonadetes bacterium]|nr:ABC transporter permease [Gemmatimonadota bacterium]
MKEVVYSADSQLHSPGSFAAGIGADARVSPPVAWQLFLRRLQSEHRRSLLGYLWLLLPPLATTGAWVALNAARVLTVGRTDLPYPLYVLTGTVLWQLFVDALNAPLQRLTASRAILTKSRIPHEAFLLAGVLDVLFNFAVRLLVLVPVLAWFGVRPAASMLLAPLGVGALLLLGFALGLLLAPVGLLYPDVPRGLTLATGIWFFLTPVLYPLPVTGGASVLRVANPVSPLLTTARGWLTGGAAAPAPGFVAVVAASLAALAVGWSCYRLARPHLVSRL